MSKWEIKLFLFQINEFYKQKYFPEAKSVVAVVVASVVAAVVVVVKALCCYSYHGSGPIKMKQF